MCVVHLALTSQCHFTLSLPLMVSSPWLQVDIREAFAPGSHLVETLKQLAGFQI